MSQIQNTRRLDEIIFGDRVRKKYENIEELGDSIKELGLIQPIVINHRNELLAGGRRYTACKAIGLVEVPVYVRYDLDDKITELEIELEENLQRNEMTWQETCLGISSIHKARSKRAILDPSAQTWTQKATGKLLKVSRAYVQSALAVATALEAGDDQVTKAETFQEAYIILLNRSRAKLEEENRRRKEEQLKKEANEKQNHTASVVSSPAPEDAAEKQRLSNAAYSFAQRCILEGDSIYDLLPKLPGQSFDHVYTDIPYGIDMDNLELKHIDETKAEHDRDDNIEMFQEFLKQSWRLIRPKGFCVFWMDIEHFSKLREMAQRQGFVVQRWPLQWTKVTNSKNNAPAYNTTKDYENAMICRKPNATLVSPQNRSTTSVTWTKGEREQYKHPFCKPHSLHKWALDMFAAKGQRILNPFCGEGSEVLSCLKLGLDVVGYDIKPIHVTRARDHVQQLALSQPQLNLC